MTFLEILATVLVITLALAILFLKRYAKQPWTPFDERGNLRPNLFTPVDHGGEGFIHLGAMSDDDLLSQCCTLCHSKVTDCGCVMGKSPKIHAALDRRAILVRDYRKGG